MIIETVEISKNLSGTTTFLSCNKYIVLWNYVVSSLLWVKNILYISLRQEVTNSIIYLGSNPGK